MAKKTRSPKAKYRLKNAIVRRVIARGLSVVCRKCGAKDQVKPADYYRNKARCPACGGLVDRVHPIGTFGPAQVDERRVVPRKIGCPVRAPGK